VFISTSAERHVAPHLAAILPQKLKPNLETFKKIQTEKKKTKNSKS
jgi:hypothetical protein